MAYYSIKVLNIYHVCKNCTVGNDIEKENLKVGQPAGARLCDECKDLQGQYKCEPGVPTPAR